MNILGWIELALLLFEKWAGTTRSTADDKIISEIRAALARANEEHGKELTYLQYEQFRYVQKWGAE